MFYVAAYAVMALLAFGLRNKPDAGRQVYVFLFVILFLLCAFRFEVGCDWLGYRYQFYYGRAFELVDAASQIRDPLWWVLIALINRLGLSYPWLNVFATSVMFAGFHILARRQPDRLAFLVLLFPILLVHIGMSGIRQAAAIGIICVALAAFTDRRLVHFVLWVVLASTIHSSAMVFLLLAPLVRGRYTRQRIALAGLLAIPGALFMAGSAAGEVALARYVTADADAAGAIFRVGLLVATGLAFFSLLRRPWATAQWPDYKLASIGSLGMIVLAALLPLSSVIADRLGYYFVPIQAVILARIPFLPLGRSKSVYMFIAYAALGLTLAVWVSLSSHYQQCYVPYQTWLFGTPASRFGL